MWRLIGTVFRRSLRRGVVIGQSADDLAIFRNCLLVLLIFFSLILPDCIVYRVYC